MYYLIILEIIVCLVLLYFMISISIKVSKVDKSKRKVEKMYILKKLIEISSSTKDVSTKLKNINDIILKELDVDKSTIVYFNGIEYIVKASNESDDFNNNIQNVAQNELLKESIEKNEVKYVKAEDDEYISLLSDEKNHMKASLFCPLYYDEVFVGYFVVSSKDYKKIEDLSIETINVLRKAIRETVSTLGYEKSLESMIRVDKYSKLESNEYILTYGKDKLDSTLKSTMFMIKISNIEKINEISRNLGNKVIEKVSEKLKEEALKFTKEAITVRYLGPIFVSAIIGKEKEKIEKDIEKIVLDIQKLEIIENIDGKKHIVMPEIAYSIYEYTKGSEIDEIENILEKSLTKNF